MKALNRLLRALTGHVLVPAHSVKMLIEQANVVATHHPSRSDRWLRHVIWAMPDGEGDRTSRTVRDFRQRLRAQRLLARQAHRSGCGELHCIFCCGCVGCTRDRGVVFR